MVRYKVTLKIEAYATGLDGQEQLQTIEDMSLVAKVHRRTNGRYQARPNSPGAGYGPTAVASLLDCLAQTLKGKEGPNDTQRCPDCDHPSPGHSSVCRRIPPSCS